AFHEFRLRRHPEDYGPQIRNLLEEGLACPATEYRRCLQHQADLWRQCWRFIRDEEFLICPATTCPAPDASTTGNPAFNSPWSYTRLPTVSFPTGHFVDGLPLAIQLVGQHQQDSKLLAAAAWCEQTLGVQPLNPPEK